MRRTMFLLMLLAMAQELLSQVHDPFDITPGENDIAAYWYNVPKDSLTIKAMGQTLVFQSTLEIYGPVPADSFAVSTVTFMPDGARGYSRDFDVKNGQTNGSYQVQLRGKYFKLVVPAHYSPDPPAKIVVTINSGPFRRTKEIMCRYHKLSGLISDFNGKPFKGVVLIRPDDFDSGTGVWSDALGYYTMLLPERIYSNVFVDDESYGLRTAEAWGWHIIVDRDQTLNFKVGTGEVYNLNVWPNNGGAKTYFVSFRPMSLHLYQNANTKARVSIDEKVYDLVDIAPDLKAKDITVRFNGTEAALVTMQKYYEWTSGKMMPAYLLQVSREGLENIGKQTVTVEYQNEGEVQGKKVVHNSLGVFQFYSNFTGLSFY